MDNECIEMKVAERDRNRETAEEKAESVKMLGFGVDLRQLSMITKQGTKKNTLNTDSNSNSNTTSSTKTDEYDEFTEEEDEDVYSMYLPQEMLAHEFSKTADSKVHI